MKKCIIVIYLLFLVSVSSYAWWNTGHELVSTFAYENMTPKTREAVNELLNIPITSPGPIFYQNQNSDYIISAASQWADNVKGKEWDPKTAKDFYSNTHFIDSLIYCNKENKILPGDAVQTEIQRSKNDNAVTAFLRAISTLESKEQSTQEKTFALLYLIHIAGDISQPLHGTDPVYIEKNGKELHTYGGNEIIFKNPIPIPFYESNESNANNLHAFWDAMGGAVPQLEYQTNSILVTNDQQKYLDDQCKTIIEGIKLNKAIDFKQLNKDLNNDPDIVSWAVDTYILSRDYALKGLDFSNAIVKNNKIIVQNPTEDYIKKAMSVSELQVYKGGIRLANTLNAIFDPGKANKKYVEFVKSLSSDETLDQLCHVDIETDPVHNI